MKRSNKIIAAIISVILILSMVAGLVTFAMASESKDGINLQEATVVRVVDGDTLVASVNGTEEKIRLIGVNTPESVSSDESKNCEEGYKASEYTKSMLPKGTKVYLEYDETNRDIYGRTLAYLWLSNNIDTTSYSDFCKYNYGAILLQNTYCESVYYAPNGKYRTWYDKLESEYQPFAVKELTNPVEGNTTVINSAVNPATKSKNSYKKIKVTSVKIKKKRIVATVKRYDSVTKYQLKYSKNKNMKKAKTINSKNGVFKSKKLKKGKYYVKLKIIYKTGYYSESKAYKLRVK